MSDAEATREAVAEAAQVLAALGLVTAFGHVSARLDATSVVVTPPIPLAEATADDVVRVRLDAPELPADAPPETWAHLAIYAARPDVAAVARGMPPASFAAGALAGSGSLAPLHGQGAWLGRAVPVHDCAALLRTAELAAGAAATLGRSHAVVLRGNGAVAVGDTPGLAVTRLWLLESLCRVHLAAPGGAPLRSAEIDAWQQAAPPLLDRLWHHLRSAVDDPGHPARRDALA